MADRERIEVQETKDFNITNNMEIICFIKSLSMQTSFA